MIETLTDLPAGVIGFEITGEIEADDYATTLVPAVERAAAEGGVRLVLVFPRWDGVSAGAAWEDLKLGVEHLRSFERTALVTDIDWMRHLVAVLGWMSPGELKLFPMDRRQDAVEWAAAG
jgi:SpoIIAA-like